MLELRYVILYTVKPTYVDYLLSHWKYQTKVSWRDWGKLNMALSWDSCSGSEQDTECKTDPLTTLQFTDLQLQSTEGLYHTLSIYLWAELEQIYIFPNIPIQIHSCNDLIYEARAHK